MVKKAKKPSSRAPVEGKVEKNQELEKQLKRALADYANLQRRVEEDKVQIAGHLRSTFIVKFLPVLDSLEATFEVVAKEASEASRKGLELSIGQLKKILQEFGVEEIDTNGDFDPLFHEAVEVKEGKQDNKIIEVLEKGYRLGSKILRAAKVKVEKKKVEANTN